MLKQLRKMKPVAGRVKLRFHTVRRVLRGETSASEQTRHDSAAGFSAE